MKKFIFATAFVFMAFIWASGAQAATLSLSPGSGSNSVGSIFTVTILLNTQSQAVDGVDIRYLNYSPTLLEAQDENTSQAGVQISAGTLLGNTVANSVDTANGRISFSQVAVGGSTYSNATGAALATVRFKVLTTGTAPVTFSFTSGSTADTNVAAGGSDVLTAVTNGSYTLQDTVAPSAPTGLVVTAVSSSQINLSWTASTDNIGVTGYRVERCQGSGCSNFAQIATPTGTSYSDTGLSASTVYAYRVRATDAAGNLSSYSGSASAATPALPDTAPPAAIANFSTSKATLNSVTLSWTAPGDEMDSGGEQYLSGGAKKPSPVDKLRRFLSEAIDACDKLSIPTLKLRSYLSKLGLLAQTPARYYIIKYRARPIDDTGGLIKDFRSQPWRIWSRYETKDIEGELKPALAGKRQYMEIAISSLSPSKAYYFGIQSVDDAPYNSRISNIAEIKVE
ncbi:MAG TPA: hypothetical protein DEA99_03530 [Candidatus Omnitrophica bacterium]|nr:hypothetical protein [Candidatus Omnitrophota bacterium]